MAMTEGPVRTTPAWVYLAGLAAVLVLGAVVLLRLLPSGSASPSASPTRAASLVAVAPTPTPPPTSPNSSGATSSAQLEPSPSVDASAQATPVASGATTPPPTPPPSTSPGASPTPKPPKPLPAYVTGGSSKKKWLALTLDADMYPWMYAQRKAVPELDPRIINLLEQTKTPATIFLNGLYVKAYPQQIKELSTHPFIELANHSWDHAGWVAGCANTTPIQPPMTMKSEVTDTADIVRQVTGVKVQFFRFPGGCHTTSQLGLVKSLGETGVGWTCYFGDTLLWTTAQQVANVEHTCGRGGIVITHLNGGRYHPNVYEALKQLIPWWKANGWQIVNIGMLTGHPTPPAKQ